MVLHVDESRNDLVPTSNVIRPAVNEYDRLAMLRASLLISNIELIRLDEFDHDLEFPGREPPAPSG
jgi:hypothetical protein